MARGQATAAARTVSVEALAWGAATLAFLALRVGLTWRAPVGGSEWVHLSGAWNTAAGFADERFIPTLFQAIAALLFEFTDSEVPARILAFAVTATVPVALYLLRPLFGSAVPLLALLLLAFDAPAIWLGVAASASAFDVALTLWLPVLLLRGVPPWSWAPVSFLLATAGPLPLVPAVAWVAARLWAREELHRTAAVYGAGGAVFGVLMASTGFGYAWQGLAIPPVDILAAWFTGGWSHPTAGALLLLYSWPLVLAGFAGALLFLLRPAEAWGAQADRLLVAWFGAGLLLLLASAGASAEAPLVAATIPAAFLAAFAIARLAPALGALSNAVGPWALAAGSLFLLTLAGAVIIDWARQDGVGPAGEVAYAALVLAGALVLLAGIFRWREARPVAAVPLAFIAAIPWIAGGVNVASSATNEPLPAPLSAFEGRVVHHLAQEAAAGNEGPIVLHPDLEEDATWPFRGSGTLTIASRVPPDAAVVIWPADLAAPEGLSRLDGSWALARAVEPPTGSLLDYIQWLSDRKRVNVTSEPIAVYIRE